MDFRQSYQIFRLSIFLFLALCLLTMITYIVAFVILGGIVLIAATIQAAVFYRCPHCRANLDFRRKIPNFCPNCGEKIGE